MAVDALQTLFRAPLTLEVHPGGQNIAYDLALVKLGAHAKFGEGPTVWISIPDTQTNTQTNTPGLIFIYEIIISETIYFVNSVNILI